MLREYGMFMDQQDPPVRVEKVLAEYDISEPYEVDQGAIFETINHKFIGVTIAGCS